MKLIPKIVKGVSIVGIITVGLTQTYKVLFFKQVRKTRQYKEAMDILYNHKKAMAYLGEPVTEGTVQVGSYMDSKSWFSVLLKGSNTKAKLVCDYRIEDDPQRTGFLTKMEITFANMPEKTFVIMHKPEGLTNSN